MQITQTCRFKKKKEKGFVKQRVSANMLFMFSSHCAVPRVHSADYYMQEAKRLKHKADALVRCCLQSLKNTGYTRTLTAQNESKTHNVNI